MDEMLAISNELGFTSEKYEKIRSFYLKIKADAEASGYFLNPDLSAVFILIDGLLVNQERYGYLGCPCRLSAKDVALDNDIICPCDYRDEDVNQFGTCYCALYVSKEFSDGSKEPDPISERRPVLSERNKIKIKESTDIGNSEINNTKANNFSNLPYPVFRCKVCGYLCAKESPPSICPICKAGKERFERFI
jgi:ferredoxin-thioredoxin reductase catalytic subunit/rubredoxin